MRLIQKVLYQHEAAFKHFVQMGHGGLAVTGFKFAAIHLEARVVCKARRCRRMCCKSKARSDWCLLYCWHLGRTCMHWLPTFRRAHRIRVDRPAPSPWPYKWRMRAPRRPLLIDDICFQASKTTYNCEPLRAVLHSGGDEQLIVPHSDALLSRVYEADHTERREGQQHTTSRNGCAHAVYSSISGRRSRYYLRLRSVSFASALTA